MTERLTNFPNDHRWDRVPEVSVDEPSLGPAATLVRDQQFQAQEVSTSEDAGRSYDVPRRGSNGAFGRVRGLFVAAASACDWDRPRREQRSRDRRERGGFRRCSGRLRNMHDSHAAFGHRLRVPIFELRRQHDRM
jgi:hypothetical protein